MAGKRMFAKDVLGSDAFCDLSFEAQALFVHLCMDADDYGFVGAPRKLVRSVGSTAKALSELEQRGFTHSFPSGVLVVLSWWQNNTITESRRKQTIHAEELLQLRVNESGLYVFDGQECLQIACEPQEKPTKPKRKAYGEYKNVMFTDEEFAKLKEEFPRDWQSRIEQCSSYCASKGKAYKNYLATIRNWAKKDKAVNNGTRDDGVFDAIGSAIGR